MTSPDQYILVVDDHVDGREMLAEYLIFRGFAVVQATQGAQALEIARERAPHVILMDLSMPGVDGWEATRRLKGDQLTQDIIVIAVTAHALQPDAANALEAGCDAFVSKPYDLELFADALASIMQHGRAALKTLSPIMQPPNTIRQSGATAHTRSVRSTVDERDL